MAAAGIYFRLIAGAFFMFSLVLPRESRGQERAVPRQFLEGLKDIDLEPVQIATDSFNILVIVSERNGSHCIRTCAGSLPKLPNGRD